MNKLMMLFKGNTQSEYKQKTETIEATSSDTNVFESFATIEHIENGQVKLMVEFQVMQNSTNSNNENDHRPERKDIVMYVESSQLPKALVPYKEWDIVKVIHNGESILKVLGKCPEEKKKREEIHKARLEKLNRIARR